MNEPKILCLALGAQANAIEGHLRQAGWAVHSASDIATAQRLLSRHEFLLCLAVLDRVDAAQIADIEACVGASGAAEWIGVFPVEALQTLALRELVFARFMDHHLEPVDLVYLGHALAHAHERIAMRRSQALPGACAVDDLGMVGQSAAIVRLRQQVRKVASTSAPILIGGESGSGKELAAQAIHRYSQRAAGPFIAVNCAAIAPTLVQSELFGHERGAFTGASGDKRGLIEMANGGTIFLDEIADLPLDLQANLLRFLQEKTINRVGSTRSLRVDARVVAASHVDLAEAVACGRFREDLFYRLNVLSIQVPPLRERMDDVPVLAMHFLRRCLNECKSPVEGFSRPAIAALMAHDWPGNVRELFNRVQRAVVMTDQRLISPADLELGLDEAPIDLDLDAARTLAERDAIRLALNRVGRNITQAARELGISRMTLYRLMEKHRIVSGA